MTWPKAMGAGVTLACIHLRVQFRIPLSEVPQRVFLKAFVMAIYACSISVVGAAGVANIDTDAPTFLVKSWLTTDGLPQNSVMAIVQTSDGYVWVGTRGGLARFDGVRFTAYGTADGLKAVSIMVLMEDGQDGLWIGTVGGGLSRWHGGKFSTLTTAEGLAHNDVMALAPDEGGGVWVGSKGGLQHWGSGGFTRMGDAESLRREVVALAADRDGGLWVTVEEKGLIYCQGGRCEPVGGPPGQERFHGYSLLVDTAGDLWVSIGNGMVLRRHAGEWTIFNETHGLPGSFIYCLAQGAKGEIWAGSQEAGLYVFRSGRFHRVPGIDAAVRAVRMSRDGVIWAGTLSGGLFRLMPPRLTSYPVEREGRRGQVNGLLEEPAGQFWVATYGGGLFRGSLDRLAPVLGGEELEGRRHLTAGLSLRNGARVVGGARGLLQMKPGTSEFRVLAFPETVTALCEDGDGSLLLATREGTLSRLINDVPQPVANGTFPASITGLLRASGSAVWVATQGAGLFRWDAGTVQQWTTAEGLPADVVRALHFDREGTLWIGTAGGGLAWMQEGRLHSVNTRHGLGDDFISQILEDDDDNLWLGCNHGIFRVAKRELQDVAAGRANAVHPLALDESDGMVTAECTGGYSPAGLRSQSGMLYFSTVRGIIALDPRQFGAAPEPPALLIEEVLLNGKLITAAGKSLSVPPGPRELELRYTAFNYAKPGQIRFRHRLSGGDQTWVETDRQRSVRFSRLAPGDYLFQVSAANQDGRWHETGASLAFTVLPFFWQTAWFKVLGLVAFATVLYGVLHRRLTQLEQARAAQHAFARQLIQSQEGERKRVSADLHDGLGQDLLLIKNRLKMAAIRQADPGELARQLDAAAAATAHAIREVRTISHALRPPALEQVGLTKAIEWLVEQFGEGSTTRFSAELDPIDGLLAPEMEVNLFRIIQEGMNNVVRHAGAAQVILEVKREAGGLHVSMFDDGCGFVAEMRRDKAGARPGLGLASMEERAHHLGSRLELQTAPGRGTRWSVSVPLPPKL